MRNWWVSDINFNLKVRAYDPNHGPLIAAGEVQEVLDSMQQELNNRSQWISVDDRLPSDTERLKESIVLVVSSAGVDIAFLRRPRLNDKYSVFLDEWRGFAIERVTHWMPLPAPPTQED
tara:strand:- start:37664 stop:38020 length:357 start_codon:yes stop_codon:yes gene_type:complete